MQKERITRAAVRLNDLIFTGVDHGDCYNQVEYEGLMGHKFKEGFMTSKGRFVDRAEAATVAYESGQLDNDPGVLSSGLLIDFHKERYEPWRPEE
ncbi:MAG: hypothetical protein WC279_12010 [Sulfurimonas sp.]|jgi:hypothetical protein|uniref:hypothetical protein n=1 Tax=Sulfurimonas sp. TaxID=2022749 RepID=UPI00356876DA